MSDRTRVRITLDFDIDREAGIKRMPEIFTPGEEPIDGLQVYFDWVADEGGQWIARGIDRHLDVSKIHWYVELNPPESADF